MTRTETRREVILELSDRAKAYLSGMGYDQVDKLLSYAVKNGAQKTAQLVENRARRPQK